MKARRRSADTRLRDLGRKRGPRKPRPPGWTIVELEAIADVTRRTIADYVRRGLLTAPEFRGTATRYDRQQLVRLLAIRTMRAQGNTRLKAIHKRLQSMGDRELEAWLLRQALGAAALGALGPAAQTMQSDPRPAGVAPPAAPGSGAETWQRLALLPGLELSWRAAAGPLVQRAVAQFSTYLERLINDSLVDESR